MISTYSVEFYRLKPQKICFSTNVLIRTWRNRQKNYVFKTRQLHPIDHHSYLTTNSSPLQFFEPSDYSIVQILLFVLFKRVKKSLCRCEKHSSPWRLQIANIITKINLWLSGIFTMFINSFCLVFSHLVCLLSIDPGTSTSGNEEHERKHKQISVKVGTHEDTSPCKIWREQSN